MAGERASVYNVLQVGAEATVGVQVAALKRLLATQADPTPMVPTIPFRAQGAVSPVTAVQQKEFVQAALSGAQSYTDLNYLYSGLLKQAVISTPAGATNTRRFTYKPSQFTPDAPVTFTVEHGSQAGAERVTGALVESLTQRWTRTEANLTGQFTALGPMQEQITLTPSPTDIQPLPIDPKSVGLYVGSTLATNFVQTATITGTPTGGTFTLSLDTQTTAPLAWNATGATVQTALQALSNINTNGVTVTGSAGGPFVITGGGSLAGLDVDLMTANSALLTGGASPTVTVVKTTPGSQTKLLRASSFEFAIPTRYAYGYTLDDGLPSWSYFVNMGIEPAATLVLEHDSVSAAYMATLRARTTNYFTLLARGPATEAGFAYTLKLQFPFKFLEASRSDVDNVYSSSWKLGVMYDSTFGGFMQADVDTLLTAL